MYAQSFFLFLAIVCSALHTYERYIGILVSAHLRGENSFAYRIQSACKNIDWKADVIDVQNSEGLKNSKYDFVINLIPCTYDHPKCKNYLAIFHPAHHYFNPRGFLYKKYHSYDGYLLTYAPGKNKKDFANSDQFPYMQWYPTVQWQEYQKVDPMHLFYICCPWGNRFDKKFHHFLSLLDKEPYTRFYGSPLFQSLYPRSYQGEIPYDGETLYKIASQAGVTLVLHSSDHNISGLPSGRIFEAAAASTVIICDQNSFVREHFKDSVLYINTNEDALSIFRQIQSHMNWIYTNKTKALEMAKHAYEIFNDKFLLEDQLLRLGEFHDRLLKQSQNRAFAWLQTIGSS